MSSIIDTHSHMTPEEVAEYMHATPVTSDDSESEPVCFSFKVRVTEAKRKEIAGWLSDHGINGTFRREHDGEI